MAQGTESAAKLRASVINELLSVPPSRLFWHGLMADSKVAMRPCSACILGGANNFLCVFQGGKPFLHVFQGGKKILMISFNIWPHMCLITIAPSLRQERYLSSTGPTLWWSRYRGANSGELGSVIKCAFWDTPLPQFCLKLKYRQFCDLTY